MPTIDPSLISTPWGLEIVAYIECSRCGAELRPGEHMKTKGYLQVGATTGGGLQVWCNRHNRNIVKVRKEQVVSFLEQIAAGKTPIIRVDS